MVGTKSSVLNLRPGIAARLMAGIGFVIYLSLFVFVKKVSIVVGLDPFLQQGNHQ